MQRDLRSNYLKLLRKFCIFFKISRANYVSSEACEYNSAYLQTLFKLRLRVSTHLLYTSKMIPIKTAKIGPFKYKIVYSKFKRSSTHGETCTSNKEILIYKDDNEQVVKETLQHEILHALLEDICASLKEIEDVDKMEEQLIRLFSPRLMDFALSNPKLLEYMWMK